MVALSTLWVRQSLVRASMRCAMPSWAVMTRCMRFARLHRLSVVINMIQLAALLFLLVRY